MKGIQYNHKNETNYIIIYRNKSQSLNAFVKFKFENTKESYPLQYSNYCFNIQRL